ncbi:MAG: sensor histidine kinase [Oculatellaceae cyanobacterium bins.114]|nr:sensor histidine kinase [Oculatellaceae cyanobacterium bins.114]
MSRFSLHPLRLLLYLEWILLGFAALTVAIGHPMMPAPSFSWLSYLNVATYAVLGLWHPQKLFTKLLYTGIELGILLLPLLAESWVPFSPPLGVVAVIRGCRMFAFPGRLMVALAVLTTHLVPLVTSSAQRFVKPFDQRFLPGAPDFFVVSLKLNGAIAFTMAILFALLLINALLSERQSWEQLMLANEQLRQYALRIEDQAALQERNRIAREIHDSLGHALTAQSIQLENALMYLDTRPAQSQTYLINAKELGSQALREVRQSVAKLRSNPLQGKPLEESIVALMQDFYTMSGIQPEYTITLHEKPSQEIGSAFYRILQEALTNIQKHSEATEVSIDLFTSSDLIHLQICDNGLGFDPAQNTTGFGLQSMQERATALGGQFRLDSHPGAGCQILVSVPLMRSRA